MKQIKASLKERAIQNQRIYIIPTQLGLLTIAVNFTLFLMGLIYGNNLVLLLAFALFSALLLIMFQTHAYMEPLPPTAIRISDSSYERPPGIKAPLSEALIHYEAQTDKGAIKTSGASQVRALTAKRGHYRVKHIKAWTRGENGFFYVWTYRAGSGSFHVYPKPVNSPLTLPQGEVARANQSGEFSGHVAYKGQARRIDWRAYAKANLVLEKNFQEFEYGSICIDRKDFPHEDELALSQMAWQVNEALARNLSWSLALGSQKIQNDKGHAHWKASMEALSNA